MNCSRLILIGWVTSPQIDSAKPQPLSITPSPSSPSSSSLTLTLSAERSAHSSRTRDAVIFCPLCLQRFSERCTKSRRRFCLNPFEEPLLFHQRCSLSLSRSLALSLSLSLCDKTPRLLPSFQITQAKHKAAAAAVAFCARTSDQFGYCSCFAH